MTGAIRPLDPCYRDRVARACGHFDSLFGDYLTGVLPEMKWVLPDRAAEDRPALADGGFPDPDRMGQAMLRNPNIKKKVPEPLRSKLRAMLRR